MYFSTFTWRINPHNKYNLTFVFLSYLDLLILKNKPLLSFVQKYPLAETVNLITLALLHSTVKCLNLFLFSLTLKCNIIVRVLHIKKQVMHHTENNTANYFSTLNKIRDYPMFFPDKQLRVKLILFNFNYSRHMCLVQTRQLYCLWS